MVVGVAGYKRMSFFLVLLCREKGPMGDAPYIGLKQGDVDIKMLLFGFFFFKLLCILSRKKHYFVLFIKSYR